MTKEEYLEAIDKQVKRRGKAINAMAEMTKAEYAAEHLVEWGDIALDAYKMARMLRSEMKIKYPTPCTCVCIAHGQEA